MPGLVGRLVSWIRLGESQVVSLLNRLLGDKKRIKSKRGLSQDITIMTNLQLYRVEFEG
jgi:hypothetical protein